MGRGDYPVQFTCPSCGRTWEGDMDDSVDMNTCCGVVPTESYDRETVRDWNEQDMDGYAEDPLGGAW